MAFYDNYVRLCAKINKSPSRVAIENNISKSNVTYWKDGRNLPSDVTLEKLSQYFGVSADYLVNGEEDDSVVTLESSSEAEKEQKNTPLFVKRDAEYLLSLLSSMPRENYLKAVEKYINDNPQQAAKMIQSALEITIESEE